MYKEIPLPRGGTRKGRTQSPNRGIVHAMGEYIKDDDGQVYHAVEWLRKCGYSAHIFVCPNADIIRSREDHQDAIHAAGNNYDTLGIEWLVPGIHNYGTFLEAIEKPYLKPGQLEAGIDFVRKEWVEALGILHYEKHCNVDPKQIKKDPGSGFPWREFLKGIGIII